MHLQHLISTKGTFSNCGEACQFEQMCFIKGDIPALRKCQTFSDLVWSFSVGIREAHAWNWIDNCLQSRLLKAGPSAGDWRWLFPNAHALDISLLGGSNWVNADTQKASDCNWIENYCEITKDSERQWRRRKGYKLSDGWDCWAQGFNNQSHL